MGHVLGVLLAVLLEEILLGYAEVDVERLGLPPDDVELGTEGMRLDVLLKEVELVKTLGIGSRESLVRLCTKETPGLVKGSRDRLECRWMYHMLEDTCGVAEVRLGPGVGIGVGVVVSGTTMIACDDCL